MIVREVVQVEVVAKTQMGQSIKFAPGVSKLLPPGQRIGQDFLISKF